MKRHRWEGILKGDMKMNMS